MRADDALIAFDGEESIFILRRLEGYTVSDAKQSVEDSFEDISPADIKERWEFIGHCYLHSFMNGEVE